MKKRLDSYLQEKEFFASRAKAAEAISLGMVKVNGKVCKKASTKVDELDRIESQKFNYVSRAAQKLLHALDCFGVDVKDKVAMDVGASTGGFTEVLLEKGAAEVFAVDTGENQLSQKLIENPKIHNMQKTNFLDVPNELVEKMDIVVSDVSFVSLTKLAWKFAQSNCPLVLLLKPQFECGKEYAKKHKGIVKDPKIHLKVIQNVLASFGEVGLFAQNIDVSPIRGGDGNVEFLLLMAKKLPQKEIDFEKIVEKAKMMV